MKKCFAHWWGPLYGLLLAGFTAYLLLDAFVIPRRYVTVAPTTTATGTGASGAADSAAGSETAQADTVVQTETSYQDGTTAITLTTYRENDTTIYVADVTTSDPAALQTAFAESTYGKNITQPASEIAEAAGAVLAVNGDYYSARSGYVIRNGVLYRESSAGADQEDLVIDAAGDFSIITEGDTTAAALLAAGARQVLSFGPALLTDGEVAVDESTEVDKARATNPRTALGQIGAGHYVLVVADGRTDESVGLSLYQLAQFMQGLGVQTAYNLDGGGSSTMIFNGAVVNQPTTNGHTISERSVSDIVCICKA